MPDNRLPTNQSQLDIVEKLDEIKDAIVQGGGGGGTGGHTIIDENGNSMTARSGLQFFGAVEVTDDSANNRTLVEVLGGDFYNPVIYSTEEREIGVWTNGKPLYQKSYIGLHVEIINVNTWYDTGLSASGVEVFVAGEMIDINNQSYPVNVAFLSSNTKIGISCAMANRTGVILTIRYTKTTDVAGSGSWTPQGVPTHHYSTDEQVIGTWIDGKTLYQKTLVVSSVGSVGSSLVTPIAINDIPFDFVTVVNANVYDNNDKRWYPLSILMKSASARIFISPYLNKDANPVVFYASLYTGGDTFSNLGELNVTIQYTKSS